MEHAKQPNDVPVSHDQLVHDLNNHLMKIVALTDLLDDKLKLVAEDEWKSTTQRIRRAALDAATDVATIAQNAG